MPPRKPNNPSSSRPTNSPPPEKQGTERYPVIYIRGYAMTSGEVEATFNRPYYGFNLGSTQYKLGLGDKPGMRIFESPVVRLIKEEGYTDSFNRFVNPQNQPIPNSVPDEEVQHDGVPEKLWRRTLWVFRFYDKESKLLGGQERGEIEDYAEQLAIFLDAVRKACGQEPDRFRVNLVAHSMGGLIARCYLQNPTIFRRRALRARKVKPVLINKLFTYGTPHGGITFRRGLGWVENVRDLVGLGGSDTFGEKRMREFLALEKDEDLRTFHAVRRDIDLSRIFCLVGTNYKDYVVWVSKKAVGPGSDGLVAVENAYVKAAPRAYVHLAHSGPFGMVNSEEGYQNLTRFLFGDLRYEISLEPITVTKDLPNLGKNDRLEYLLVDLNVVVRGLAVYVQVRREVNQSSIILEPAEEDNPRSEFPREHLYTGYLRLSQRLSAKKVEMREGEEDQFMRGAIDLRIEPHYLHDGWIRDSRFEGETIMDQRLHIAFGWDGKKVDVRYRWSTMPKEEKAKESDGSYLFPLPPAAQQYLKSNGVRIRVFGWR